MFGGSGSEFAETEFPAVRHSGPTSRRFTSTLQVRTILREKTLKSSRRRIFVRTKKVSQSRTHEYIMHPQFWVVMTFRDLSADTKCPHYSYAQFAMRASTTTTTITTGIMECTYNRHLNCAKLNLMTCTSTPIY